MRATGFVFAVCLSMGVLGGCSGDLDLELEDVLGGLRSAIGPIQTRSQDLPPVLVDQGDTIIIDNRVTIIDDLDEDIVIVDVPNITVLTFENYTGRDIYLTYYADDQYQGVYVYDGETLLLEYPCLSVIELISEDDIDPFSGVLIDSFDLTGINFFNPEDFYCGDAYIITFDLTSLTSGAEPLY